MSYYSDKRKMNVRIEQAIKNLKQGLISSIDLGSLFYDISLYLEVSEKGFNNQIVTAVKHHGLFYDDLEKKVFLKEVEE